MNRQHAPASWLAGLVLAALIALPGTTAAASTDGPAQGFWLASTSLPPTGDVAWGRLVVKDGMLTFFAARSDWQTPLAEIKRVALVKGSDRSFEIETVSGAVLRLSILGPRMLTESPKKAMQVIQRAVREAPPVPRTVVTTASGTGIR